MEFIFVSLAIANVVVAVAAAAANGIPAMFVFGDSLADDGNNNYLPTFAKANFPPYGDEFDTGKPTGRFMNGRNSIDYLATRLGLPLIPPYLDPSTKGYNLLNGVNFASGGSGILDITDANVGQLLSLNEQVVGFSKVKQEIVRIVGSANATMLLSKALFTIVTGNNDYTMTFPLSLAAGDASSFQNLLLSNLIAHIRRLYEIGARRFLVSGVGAVGCAPSQLNRYNSVDGSCVNFLNNPVIKYNAALYQRLSQLKLELSASSFIYTNLYIQMITVIRNPAPYGVKVVDEACCGGFGRYRGIQSCLPGVPVCSDVSKFYFWDSYHPSSRMCEVIADMMFSMGPPYNYPSSLQKLFRI